MSLVSLVKVTKSSCPFKEAISQSLKLINYSFNPQIKKVILKPNLCYYWDCTTGQTTQPRFVAELVDFIRQQTSNEIEIAIVESDASAMRCKYAFQMLGFEKLAKEKGVRLINLTEDESRSVDVSCNGKSYTFFVPKTIYEADLRINIAHIKYTVDPIKLTCALKNIYGCNPNPKKFQYHSDLGNVIVALNKVMKFDLCFIDNDIAAGVQPKKLGLIMASQDSVAVDVVAAKIAGLNPLKISYLSLAEREGVGRMAFVPKGEQPEFFRAMYPKKTLKIKTKAQAYNFIIRCGLGSKLGIE